SQPPAPTQTPTLSLHDALPIFTDMQEHGRLNKQALQNGKHVWSEKPMANTYKEGKALLDLAKSKKLRIWGAPAVVNSPQFAFMSDRKSTRLNSSHVKISYAVFC